MKILQMVKCFFGKHGDSEPWGMFGYLPCVKCKHCGKIYAPTHRV